MKSMLLRVRVSVVALLCFSALLKGGFAFAADKPDWQVKLEVAESCSCAPACPCIFGSVPTRGYCHVNFWMHINKGHYGPVRLDGVSLLMTDEMRKSRRYYFDTGATPAQVEAVTNLFSQIPALRVQRVVSVEQVPLQFQRSGSHLSYSAPASHVEMQIKMGPNGKPITIQNTGLSDYIQYVSVTNSHRSDSLEFAYSGTSAATWKLQAKGQ